MLKVPEEQSELDIRILAYMFVLSKFKTKKKSHILNLKAKKGQYILMPLAWEEAANHLFHSLPRWDFLYSCMLLPPTVGLQLVNSSHFMCFPTRQSFNHALIKEKVANVAKIGSLYCIGIMWLYLIKAQSWIIVGYLIIVGPIWRYVCL